MRFCINLYQIMCQPTFEEVSKDWEPAVEFTPGDLTHTHLTSHRMCFPWQIVMLISKADLSKLQKLYHTFWKRRDNFAVFHALLEVVVAQKLTYRQIEDAVQHPYVKQWFGDLDFRQLTADECTRIQADFKQCAWSNTKASKASRSAASVNSQPPESTAQPMDVDSVSDAAPASAAASAQVPQPPRPLPVSTFLDHYPAPVDSPAAKKRSRDTGAGRHPVTDEQISKRTRQAELRKQLEDAQSSARILQTEIESLKRDAPHHSAEREASPTGSAMVAARAASSLLHVVSVESICESLVPGIHHKYTGARFQLAKIVDESESATPTHILLKDRGSNLTWPLVLHSLARECKVLALLQTAPSTNSAIPRLFGFDYLLGPRAGFSLSDDRVGIALEWVVGTPLHVALHPPAALKKLVPSGPLAPVSDPHRMADVQRRLSICRQIVQGVLYLHSLSIYLCDLTPSSVMVTSSNIRELLHSPESPYQCPSVPPPAEDPTAAEAGDEEYRVVIADFHCAEIIPPNDSDKGYHPHTVKRENISCRYIPVPDSKNTDAVYRRSFWSLRADTAAAATEATPQPDTDGSAASWRSHDAWSVALIVLDILRGHALSHMGDRTTIRDAIQAIRRDLKFPRPHDFSLIDSLLEPDKLRPQAHFDPDFVAASQELAVVFTDLWQIREVLREMTPLSCEATGESLTVPLSDAPADTLERLLKQLNAAIAQTRPPGEIHPSPTAPAAASEASSDETPAAAAPAAPAAASDETPAAAAAAASASDETPAAAASANADIQLRDIQLRTLQSAGLKPYQIGHGSNMDFFLAFLHQLRQLQAADTDVSRAYFAQPHVKQLLDTVPSASSESTYVNALRIACIDWLRNADPAIREKMKRGHVTEPMLKELEDPTNANNRTKWFKVFGIKHVVILCTIFKVRIRLPGPLEKDPPDWRLYKPLLDPTGRNADHPTLVMYLSPITKRWQSTEPLNASG